MDANARKRSIGSTDRDDGVGKRSFGSTVREDDAYDIEGEDECVLSKLGDGKGRRGRLDSVVVPILMKWSVASSMVEVYCGGKMRGTCIQFRLVCFSFKHGGRRGGSVGLKRNGW